MPDNGAVIITGRLDDTELIRSIDKLVQEVDTKLGKAAETFENNIGRMQTALDNFANSAKNKVNEIRTSFSAMGTAFDTLRKAIEKAANAWAANHGGGAGAWNGGANPPAGKDTIGELREQIKAQKKKIDQQKQYTDELQKEVNLLAEQKRLLKQQTTPAPVNALSMSEKTLNDISAKMQAIRQLRASLPVNSAEIGRLNAEYARLSKMQSEIIGKNATLIESNNALGRAFNYIKNRLAFALTIGAATGFVRQLYEIRGQYELLERSLGVLLDSFQKGSQIFNELNAMAIKSPFTLIELGTAAKQLTAYNFKATEVVNTTRRLADISAALGVPMERLVYNLGQIRAQTVLTARDARDFANAGLAIVPELAKHYSKLEGRVVSTADVFDRMKKKAVSYNDVMIVLNSLTDEGGKFFDFQAKQAGTLKVQLANLNLAWNNMLNDIGKSNQGLVTFPLQGLRQAFMHWKDISNMIKTAVAGLGAYKVAQFVITRSIGTSVSALQANAKAEARANITRLERIKLTRMLTESEDELLLRSRLLVSKQRTMSEIDYMAALSSTKLSQAQAMSLVAMNKKNDALQIAMVRTKILTQAQVEQALAMGKYQLIWQRLGITIAGFFRTLKAAIFNPTMAWMAVLTIGMEIWNTYTAAEDAVKNFNKAVSDGAKESVESLKEFTKQYQTIQDSLYTWGENKEGERVQTGTKDINSEEAKKTWEAIREEIIKSSAAGQDVVAELETISNINDRLRAGFTYVGDLKKVQGTLEEISEKTIKVQQDWSKWWNLWTGYDSLKENLGDYMDDLDDVVKHWGSVEEAKKKAISRTPNQGAKNDIEDLEESLKTLRINLQETAGSMVELFAKKGFNAQQERAAFNQITNKLVEDLNLTTEQSLVFRQQLEERYLAMRLQLFKKENKENAQSSYDAWVDIFGRRQQLEDEFLRWMVRNNYAKTQEMFGNMSAQQIAQIDWSKPKWRDWATENAQAFTKQYNLSFLDLQHLVNNANKYSIRIPVFFDFQNQEKTIYETLTDADAAANKAYATIQRLNEGLKSGKLFGEAYKKAQDELTAAEKDYADALAQGGKAKAADRANAKRAAAAKRAQAKAESELQKALKEELQIIDKVQAAYKSLTRAGVNHADALTISTSGYEKSAKQINNVFKKWGLEKFDAAAFAGLENPREILNMLQKQLDKLVASGKAKPEEIKDLEVKINQLVVSAKEFDMKKITDGLNNELGKIKEEYELAVELEANPELGQMFAESFGIDTTNFPKTVQDAVDMMQDSVDEAIAKSEFGEGIDIDPEDIMHPFNILQDDIEKWAKETGQGMESELVKKLMDAQKQARDLVTKDAKQTIQDWQNLLEKYAEYETKKAEIQRKAEQERETARKHGASQEIFDAIDLKELREIEKLNFDEFQKSATWITATGDISNLTNKALQMLIDRLWEYKKAAKNLDPKEIIRLNNALRKLRKEQKKDNPFAAWSIMLDEAKQRMEQYQPDIDELSRKIQNLLKKQAEQHGILSDEDNQTLAKYLKNLEKLRKEQNEVGKLTLGDKLGAIQKYSSAIKEIADSIINIADGLGADKISKAAQGFKDALGIIDKAEAGYKLGGQYGAIAGALVGITEMLIKWYDDNEDINEQIEYSQRAVKRLENQYKSLQHTMEQAYGVAKYGAQQAMIYNKKMQLEALEEQLRLEKSRKGKHKDEDAIISLEGQIIDLKNEIHDAINSIVNDMLGISSVGDAAENVVKSMIDAFKNGEDYMKVFEDSFDDMIDNMIAKTIVSRLIGDFIQGIFDQIKARKVENASGIADSLSYAQGVLQGLYDFANEFGMTDSLQQNINEWEENVKKLQDAYKRAITPTPEDIEELQETVAAGKASIKEGFDAWMAAFGIQFGQNAGETQLSALQQGIQGITEDTAGALEAYMNGVSQQVYLQSDLLTQIRDILVNFGGDVTIATNAQILLQLQQSFQVQMTIQNVLTGVLNASGLAFRVEMV